MTVDELVRTLEYYPTDSQPVVLIRSVTKEGVTEGYAIITEIAERESGPVLIIGIPTTTLKLFNEL